MEMFGVSPRALSIFFKECGYPLARVTVRKRLDDQKWLYVHAELLRRLDMWEEPTFYAVARNASRMFAKHRYGGKVLGQIGEANPAVIGTVIKVNLPKDEEV